jgi:carnitine-CoA ligase
MIGDWIRAKADKNGDRVALEVLGETLTYAQLDERTDRAAAGFAALGLRPGDKVCVMMRNSVANVEAWLGLCKAGLVEVPINTANRGYLLEYIIRQSDARAIVCDAEFLPRLEGIAPEHVIVPGRDELPDGPVPHPKLRPRDTSVILYTSGTTGPSKGVVLSHNANLALARSTCRLMRYTSEDVLYTVFPLFHINAKYTSVMAAMEADARLVMEERFSASRFWDTCRTKGVTAFNYQGALLLMLFKQPPREDDHDNPVRVGFGAPCPADLWEPFEQRFGVRLVDVYGMTEIAIATANSLDERRIGTAGKAADGYEVRIVDPDDRPVPPDTPGEIVVRPTKPDILISEYYGQEEATLEAFRNLWFHTGDRGRMDADGYLTFIDRMKDAIRRRGENISSWEVEQVVNAHEDVLECAAYGVRSEEEVAIAIVLQPGCEFRPLALLEHCAERMAHFAVPRYVRVLDELPRTPSQRLQKYKLRDAGITRDAWDAEAHGFRAKR